MPDQPTITEGAVTEGAVTEDDAETPRLRAVGSTMPRVWALMACALASLLCVSGLILVCFVEPSTSGMARSLIDLREVYGLGSLRALHVWASHGLMIVLWLHLLRVFAQGSYRRLHDWRSTLIALLLILGIATSGHALGHGTYQDDQLRLVFALHVMLLPLLTAAIFGIWRAWR